MRTLLTYLLVSIATITFGQLTIEKRLLAGPEWFDGSVLLTNGKELRGLVKYNDKSDIVSIENGYESKSFTARHVKAFEFFDEVERKQRMFYAVEVEDRVNNIRRPLFFELLMDTKEFALISKVAPIRIDRKEYTTPAMFNPATGSFNAGRYYGYPATISHTETLFFFSKEGEIRPYLEIKEKEIDGMFYDRSIVKNKILDEAALEQYTNHHYKRLISYAKENALDIKEKKDLMSLLSYYNQINR